MPPVPGVSGGRRRVLRVLALAGPAAVAVGCASTPVDRLLEQPAVGLPRRVRLDNLPFFPQETDQCGPAALATVFSQAGQRVLPEDLVRDGWTPDLAGSLQTDLLASTRRQGLLAWTLEPTLEALLRAIAAGWPVVILQNLSLPIWPKWHYAVVHGFDLDQRVAWLHSGRQENLSLSLDTLDHTWARSGRWALLALPAHRLPPQADAARHARAVMALERVDTRAARDAWRAATAQWPDEALAWLGLGNASIALDDLRTARHAFVSLVNRHPEHADGWNNLAWVLGRLGDLESAQGAIGRALSLGGPHRDLYRQTAEELDALARRAPR